MSRLRWHIWRLRPPLPRCGCFSLTARPRKPLLSFLLPNCRPRFERGEVWSYRDAAHQLVIDPYTKTATLYDAVQGTVIYWSLSASGFSYHETSLPLRLMWRWWLEPRGLWLTHAAAIATEHGAVLVAGPGGMGKSTTALACLNAGLGYLGDDFVLVRIEPVPRVYSLYCSAKVHTANLRNFAPLANRVINPERNPADKAMLMLDHKQGDTLVADAPLRGLFIPHIRSGSTQAYAAGGDGTATVGSGNVFHYTQCESGRDGHNGKTGASTALLSSRAGHRPE